MRNFTHEFSHLMHTQQPYKRVICLYSSVLKLLALQYCHLAIFARSNMSKKSRSKITSFKRKYQSHDIAVTVNVQDVHPQLQHRPSVALRTPWQLCLLLPEVGCPKLPAGLPSVRRSFSVLDGTCDWPPTLPQTWWSKGCNSGEFGGHWSLAMKSGQLVWSQFCMVRAVRAGEPVAGRCIHWATVKCSRRQDWEGDGQRSMQNPL